MGAIYDLLWGMGVEGISALFGMVWVKLCAANRQTSRRTIPVFISLNLDFMLAKLAMEFEEKLKKGGASFWSRWRVKEGGVVAGRVIDMAGRVLHTTRIRNAVSAELNLRNLSPGMYAVEVFDGVRRKVLQMERW